MIEAPIIKYRARSDICLLIPGHKHFYVTSWDFEVFTFHISIMYVKLVPTVYTVSIMLIDLIADA